MFNSINNSVWFSRRISDLRSRVKKLKQKSSKASSQKTTDLESEVNRCSTMLQKLLDYAKSNRVGTQRDCYLLEHISKDIYEVKTTLENKKPWWQKLLNILVKAFPIIQQLLTLLASYVGSNHPLIVGCTGVLALIARSFEVAGLLNPASDTPPSN